MLTDASIVQRVAALEEAVAELQRRLGGDFPAVNWLERFTGAFKDEPAFAEVIEYGRAFRAADQPLEKLKP